MNKKRFCISVIVCALSMLLFTGCATNETTAKQNRTDTGMNIDWESGFTIGEITNTQEWNVSNYVTNERNKNIAGELVQQISLRLGENDFKNLEIYRTGNGYDYCINNISMDGRDNSEKILDNREWILKEEMVTYFDILDDKCYFGIESNSGKQAHALPEHIYIIITDMGGHPEKTVDIKEGLESLGCKNRPSWMYIDSDGYFYFMGSEENTTLYVVDSEGEGILIYECKSPSGDCVFMPVRDNHGRIFFPVFCGEEGDTILLWKDQSNSWKELTRLENRMVMDWYTMRDNQLFYAENDSLIRWDVLTGNRECILNFKENGIPEYWYCMLRVDENGELYLRNYGEETEWFAKVSSEAPVYENTLTVGITVEGNTVSFLKGALATFGRKSNNPIQVQHTESHAHGNEVGEKHLLIDAVNGSGTDIMYVSYQDFVNLQSKGALLELSELIPKDIREKLLPNVLTFGMIEEELYGMPIGLDLHTMFVNSQIYDGSGWSIEEVLRLVKENTQLQCIITADTENAVYYEVLSALIGYDLGQEKSCFIDWESKTGCFEAAGFTSVLELVKKTGFSKEYSGKEDIESGRDRLVTKGALGFPCNACDPVFFNYLMNEFGDICYPVGYPAEDYQGNYVTTEGLLAVSANISEEKKEALKQLFEYLFTSECQKGLHDSLSVLKGSIWEHIEYEEHMDKTYWSDGTSSYIVLWQSEDGSAYMNMYEELLESAQVYKVDNKLLQIVLEECVPFFMGDRSALDVTRKIDNRVQLYLDENY